MTSYSMAGINVLTSNFSTVLPWTLGGITPKTMLQKFPTSHIPFLIFLHMQWFHSFMHSFGMCRMRRFLAVLRSFFHSSLLRTFSCHPFPPTILPSSLTSSCHLFLGLPLNLVVPIFSVHAQTNIIYLTLLSLL